MILTSDITQQALNSNKPSSLFERVYYDQKFQTLLLINEKSVFFVDLTKGHKFPKSIDYDRNLIDIVSNKPQTQELIHRKSFMSIAYDKKLISVISKQTLFVY